MSSRIRELAAQLLESGSPERLETPLDALAAEERDGDFAEQLLAAHVEGVAHTLREALEGDRLADWVEQRCTAREETAVADGLDRWLGRLEGGGDDPESQVRLPALPEDERGLTRWAAQHGVEGLLHEAFEAAGGVPLLSACLGETRATPGSLLDAGDEARAARRHLRHAAARRAALAQRRERLHAALPEGPLRLLQERLRALLATTTPEALESLRFVPAYPVRLDADTGVARARLRPLDGTDTVAVRLLLSGYEHAGLVGECGHCEDAGCLHTGALAARLLDATLEPDDRLHPALRQLVQEPSWKRFVRELAPAGDEAPDDASPDQRLCFRVQPRGFELRVGAFVQKRVRGGTWSGGKLAAANKLLRQTDLGDDDRHVLQAMARRGVSPGPGYVSADVEILRALIEHPVCYLEGEGRAAPLPLHVSEQRLSLELRPGPRGLTPHVSLADRPLPRGNLRKASSHVQRLDAQEGSLVFAVLTPRLRRLLTALDHFRGALPPESHAALSTQLAGLRGVADVRAPDSLLGRPLPPPRKLLLRILPGFDEAIDVALSTRPLPLGALWPPGRGPEQNHGLVDGKPVYTHRDLAWERQTAHALLEELGLREHLRRDDFRYRIEGTQAALTVLSAAARRADVLDLEWAERGRRPQLGPSLRAGDLKVRLFKRGEWLKLKGRASHPAGDVPVQRLLEAARTGERFVRVEGDHYAEIERELFDLLERTQLCVVDVRALQPVLARASLPYALAHLPGDIEVEADARDWVEAARSPQAAALDERWEKVLRDYQRQGVRWLLSMAAWAPGCCLADEMGLGKTLQAIALLAHRAQRGPALVVAPTSVARNWMDELTRFAPELRATLIEGARSVAEAGSPGAGDVWVMSYERLLRDREALSEVPFATQVVDEAQLLKNARTRRAQATRAVQAEFRLALSGTPVENRLGDLWSLFQLIAPGLLGSWARFRAIFAVPIERHQDADRAAALRALVAPLLLRRLKRDVAPQLPTRTESVQLVALSPAERALYDSTLRRVRKHLAQPRVEQTQTMTVLAELTRLRQLACHPRLVLDEPSAESSKLAALLQLLDDIVPRGHRVLIFSQFVRHLELAREALEARGLRVLYLDGSTPAPQRARLVERFQAGDGQAFLISLKAGGTGLNLTAADYVIHLDPWWNPAAEDQASDRAHRIGQQRPVTIVKLVAEDTIEERVLALHGHKRELSSAVLDARSDPAALDVDAMRQLLGMGAG